MNLIITPVYLAWDKVKLCIKAVQKNTANDFLHVLVTDSCQWPADWPDYPRVVHLNFDDHELPEKHTAHITSALQTGWDWAKQNQIEFDHVFILESDCIVPQDWDRNLIMLSQLIPPDLWVGLEAFATNEEGKPEYPMPNNPSRGTDAYGGKNFQITDFNDWNCVLLNNRVLENLQFDSVPSHHDILLSRQLKEKFGGTCYRTQDVNIIHYPNSSRNLLPKL
jgi:hypothetical protein